MKKIIRLSVVSAMAITTLNAADVNSFEEMFKEGEVGGQIRLGHFTIDTKDSTTKDTYVTAIGGQLKYESASFSGLSGGVAIYTSHSIGGLSGTQDLNNPNNNKFNTFLTSEEKNYTELGEAYINYTRDSFNLRVG
ncbi:MAG: hypothetical protein JXQ66_07820, partial [Campylobacterales bacterium]|nr:hypothetical protein [Campylobacterales bacterium]